MRLWRHGVFPRLLDLSMGRLDELRLEALAPAHGDVLEIGFGTGRNLGHYPAAVRRLVALDPLPVLGARVGARIERAPFPVEHVPDAAGSVLPFEEERFDCVVTTWTLCSIPEAPALLADVRRVLKPGGRYVFIEHGRSDDERTARWQARLNPIHARLTGGCHLDRPIDEWVRKSGLELTALDRFRYRGPRIFAEMYRGHARRG